MKDKLSDLNNHLFCQLERLNNDDLEGVELEDEIKRSIAMANLAGTIIQNASLILKARIAAENMPLERKLPLMLTD